MPQKANPILSEAVVGMSTLAKQQVPAMLTAMQAGHERAAGEWQIEWDALPSTFTLAAGCVGCTHQIIEGLQVFPERMRSNLGADGGMIMAEAVMIHLAPLVGRARAHDLVYAACAVARDQEISLIDSLRQSLDRELLDRLPPLEDLLDPDSYLGEAQLIVSSALDAWSQIRQPAAR